MATLDDHARDAESFGAGSPMPDFFAAAKEIVMGAEKMRRDSMLAHPSAYRADDELAPVVPIMAGLQYRARKAGRR